MKAERNKGFTLIEVIVSMLILTIVAVPLISTFYTSASANRRTAKNQNASLAAQSIMEMAKGYDIEAFPSAVRTAIATGAGIEAGEISYTESYQKADNSGNLGSNLGRWSADCDVITYNFTNVKLGGDTYDARVTYDALAYKNDTAPDQAEFKPEWNEFKISDIYNVDSRNTVLMGDTGFEYMLYDGQARDSFWQMYQANRDLYLQSYDSESGEINKYDTDNIYSGQDMEPYIQRTTEIMLDVGDNTGDVKILWSIEYEAHGEITDMGGEIRRYPIWDSISNKKTINADNLQRLYLFYPFYKHIGSTYDDIIAITITPALRRYYDDTNPEKEIGIYIILPKDVVDGVNSVGAKFKINGTEISPSQQIDASTRNSLGINYLRFYSQKLISLLIEKSDESEASDMFKKKDEINRIYNVKVELFERGALSSGSPDDKRLAVMESAKTR